MKRVSVVIPVYNVEPYLDRCVRSVLSQSYRNLEILLVEDGSPDRCPELCDAWAGRDSRVKVIHKLNEGLGMARNTGMAHASGEYLYFLDSDDYLAPDAVEKCVALAEKEQADLVTFGYCRVSPEGKILARHAPSTPKPVYAGEEVLEQFLPELIGSAGKRANLWMSACGTFCAAGVIRSTAWQFASEREIISEDVYSLLSLYRGVSRVAVLPEALYFYCETPGSLTHAFREDRDLENNRFHQACVRLCRELGYPREVIRRLSCPYVSNLIGALKLIVRSDRSRADRLRAVSRIVLDGYFQRMIHEMDLSREPVLRRLLLETARRKSVRGVYAMALGQVMLDERRKRRAPVPGKKG